MGDKQSRADRKIEAERTSESAAADSPDVIDLRPLEDGNGNGATARGGSETTPRSDGRALTASEGWEWLDLGLRISDAQLDVRRTTSRPMNFDRADVRPRTAGNGAAPPATDRVEPVLEPPADPSGESTDGPATPASGRLTWRDWSNWVRLGRTISDEEDLATPANGEVAAAANGLVAAEPEVAEAEPEVAEAEPDIEPEAEPDAELEAEPDVEEVADVTEVEAEPDIEPEAEPDVAEVADVAEVQAEPDVEPDVEEVADVTVAEAEPDVEEAGLDAEQAEPDAEVADIAEADVAAADIDAMPKVAETAVIQPEVAEPEVVAVQSDVAAPAAARTDPQPMTRLAGRPQAVVAAVVITVVLLVAVIAVALAMRDDKPTPSTSARPTASGAAPTPAGTSLAVRWLEQNTAVGTRLLVPPELVDDFAAGLPGRQVLPNDQVAARTGDLLVVTPDSGDVLTGTLTQQVLAAAPVVARLPGSDLEVHQVTGTNPADDVARASAGTELLQNLGLTFVGGASALRSGMVDERVLVILAGLAAQHSLTVALVPDPADAPDALVRTLQIQEVDGQAITAANAPGIKDFVTSQRGALAGPVVNEVDDGTKRQIFVTYLLPVSVELLNSGSFPTVSQESQ